jgi:hypothetical protein
VPAFQVLKAARINMKFTNDSDMLVAYFEASNTALMIKAARISESSVNLYQNTWYDNPRRKSSSKSFKLLFLECKFSECLP